MLTLIKTIIDNYYVTTRSIRKSRSLKKCKRVIWIAEVGSRDFLPRLTQAKKLWETYKIPSIILHKHFLKCLDKKDYKNTLMIDKSCTLACLPRFRYSRLRGAITSLIPEELITVSDDMMILKTSLNKNSLAQVDYIFSSNNIISEYAKENYVSTISAKNPRFNIEEINKLSEELNILKMKAKKKNYILINDNTSAKYSSFESADITLKKLFNNTGYDPNKFAERSIKEDEKATKNLVELVKMISQNYLLKDLDIIIRPHPDVNIEKFKSYFLPLMPKKNKVKIERKRSAIEMMQGAIATFHQNCTTGVEGYYAGLNNIYNFSENPRHGYSKNMIDIIPCLGVKKSIRKLILDLDKHKKENIKTIPNELYERNLFEIIGEKMKQNSNVEYPFKIKEKREKKLKKIFKDKEVFDYSAKDRWSYAEKIIKKLNKKQYKDLLTLGKVGIIVGKWG